MTRRRRIRNLVARSELAGLLRRVPPTIVPHPAGHPTLRHSGMAEIVALPDQTMFAFLRGDHEPDDRFHARLIKRAYALGAYVVAVGVDDPVLEHGFHYGDPGPDVELQEMFNADGVDPDSDPDQDVVDPHL